MISTRLDKSSGVLDGATVIFAGGFPFGHEPSLDAYWVFNADKTLLDSSASGFTIGTDTLDSVSMGLMNLLPDTATAPKNPVDSQPPLWAMITTIACGIAMGGALVARRRSIGTP